MTNAEQATGSIERRHDLDALRAFAMLLGIVLHGALAFIPGAWAVSDTSVEGEGTPFGILVTAIHGFRMPVFFLMSGFFTAMLWRQRGLQALVRHRARRVLLPLAIAMFTVIPLMWVAWGYAESVSKADDDSGAEVEVRAEDNVWAAAALGDSVALERHAAAGATLDAVDPVFLVSPLAWAALHGRTEAAEWLLDNGAKVNARNGDGSTALHSAAFMGRPEVVRLLLDRGADADAVDANGLRPLDSSRVDAETTAWVAELLGLSYDARALEEGRREAARLLGGAARTDAEGGVVEERTDTAGGVAPYREGADADVDEDTGLLVPWYWEALYAYEWGRLFTEDVFSHLWFLWYLVWLVAAFALIAWIAARLGLSLSWLPERLVVTPALYVWAVPVTMAAQYFMGVEGAFPEFGPDTFTGLLPRAARTGVLRNLLRVRGRLLRPQRERGAHRAVVAADAAACAGRAAGRPRPDVPRGGRHGGGRGALGFAVLPGGLRLDDGAGADGALPRGAGSGERASALPVGRLVLAVPDAPTVDRRAAGIVLRVGAALGDKAGVAGRRDGRRAAGHLRMGRAVHAGGDAAERTAHEGEQGRGVMRISGRPR